jgi:hypothetical protein
MFSVYIVLIAPSSPAITTAVEDTLFLRSTSRSE